MPVTPLGCASPDSYCLGGFHMLTYLFVVIIVTSTFKNLLLSLIIRKCMCLPLSMSMRMDGYKAPGGQRYLIS